MNSKVMYIGIGVLVGIVFAGQIRKLPLVGKIPTV